MGDKKLDLDLDWPTFDPVDQGNRVSYSPDADREQIFTEFKPATKDHKIRNKKRKPKKPVKGPRLISGWYIVLI